jgi:hypothetical protein
MATGPAQRHWHWHFGWGRGSGHCIQRRTGGGCPVDRGAPLCCPWLTSESPLRPWPWRIADLCTPQISMQGEGCRCPQPHCSTVCRSRRPSFPRCPVRPSRPVPSLPCLLSSEGPAEDCGGSSCVLAVNAYRALRRGAISDRHCCNSAVPPRSARTRASMRPFAVNEACEELCLIASMPPRAQTDC